MQTQIKKPSQVMAKQHNRKRKGGLVAGALLTGMLLAGQAVSADEIVKIPATLETTVVSETSTVETTTTETKEASLEKPSETISTATVEQTTTTTEPTTTTADPTTTTAELTVTKTPKEAVPLVAEEAPKDEKAQVAEDLSSKANVTAIINNGSPSGQNTIYSNAQVKTQMNTTVQVGDYVTYVFHNLPVEVLNGQDVKTSDGKVIGKISVVSAVTAFQNQMNGTSSVKQNLAPSATEGVVRVTFNTLGASLNGLLYNFIINQNQPVTIVSKDATVNQSVVVNGKTVGTASFVNKAAKQENPSRSRLGVLQDRDVLSEGDRLVPKNLQLGLVSTYEEPVNKGDQLKLTFGQNSTISFKEEVLRSLIGQTVEFIRTRGYFDGMQSNSKNVVVYDDTTSAFLKVVSVADKAIVFESLGNLLKDASYTGVLRNGFKLDKVNPKTIDVKNKLVKGIDYTFELVKDGKTVSTIETNDATLKIYGAEVSASAFNKRGTVRIEYRDVVSNNTIHASDFVLTEQVVGTNYDATNKLLDEVTWENGRRWVKTGNVENVQGKVVEGVTTLVQYFKEVVDEVPSDAPKTEIPPAPETPKAPNIPEQTPPTPQIPVVGASVVPTLPNTGEVGSILSVVGVAMASVVSWFGFKKKED